MSRSTPWFSHIGVLILVFSLVTISFRVAGADDNVPPGPPAGQSGVIPPAPVLKPLPLWGVTRAPAPESLSGIISDPVLEMRALVLYQSGDADGVLATIRAYLEILGTPYDAIDTALAAPAGAIEESDLWDGVNRGLYQAVFITTSNVWYTGLDPVERSLLEAYERAFGVRQVTLYAFPNAVEYGLDFVAVAPSPLNAALSADGQAVFGYLNPNASLPFQVYGYQAEPAAGANLTPLLLDSMGYTLLAVHRPGDGREHMVFTMSSFYPVIPPSNVHARLLPYGMINWALRGLFIGERHVYFAPQADDLLSWGDCWDSTTHSYILDICYRNEPDDLENLVAQQIAFGATTPNAAGFRIEMPFNSDTAFEGDPPEIVNGQPVPGTLTAKAVELQSHFTWLNHTYSHADLDHASYALSYSEISQNNAAASVFGWTDYSQATLLTGDYSGLGRSINPPTVRNPALAQAAFDLGVEYVLANASDPLFSNPSPNTGIPHPDQPTILQVPRYANNIFYAASTPDQETDLYNWIYCPGYAADPDNTPPCYDYASVLDSVTNQALGFLLDFSVNPTMFHMNNLDAYDSSGRTLLTDFAEALYGKYNAYYANNVPVLTLRTQEIGQRMRDRSAFNASGVSGELRCGDEITLRTTQAAAIPVTGVSYGPNVETYAGQTISSIAMPANGVVVIPGAEPSAPEAVDGLSAARSDNDVVLSWNATTHGTGGQPMGALAYRVYGYTGPADGVPAAQFTLLAEVTSPSYTHVGAAGGPEIYTYMVTAVGDNCWKRESAESERLAKAVWTVKPGYNLLSVSLVVPDPSVQAMLGTQLAGGDSVDSGDRVLKFDPVTQGYQDIAVYIDGTGTPFDGNWYDVFGFPNNLSDMTLNVHDGFWVQHRAPDERQVVIFGRPATSVERTMPISAGPFQVIGSGALGPLVLGSSNLWESGASGGQSLDTGDRLLRFDAGSQVYDASAVLIDGSGSELDGTWADAATYPSPSAMTLDPGRGYWFQNRTPADPFYWSYPRP